MRKRYTLFSFIALACICLCAKAQTTYTLVSDNYNPLSYEIPKEYVEGKHYVPKHIIFKLKEGSENALAASTPLSEYLQLIGAQTAQLFPQAKSPQRKTDAYGRKLVDLTRVYVSSYTANIPVKEVMFQLKKSGVMEYVQPKIIVQQFSEDKVQFTPNDPGLASQWHITKINAPQAWDISTGSSSVVVAITDGGTNFSHADLQNVAYNTADPIDGIDNDGDGWIDNYRGWNTGSNNNNPQYNVGGGQNHGVASTGTAAATVNNATNGVGISYNSPYLPVKIADASNNFTGAEPGVFYAAEKGAKIINCSWGGTAPWPLLEDVTKYAVYNKGCFIAASAGNGNNTTPYWPASYDWVMGVAGSNSSDLKSSTSSYYDFVDITAPGEAIFTTSANTFANVGVGTSWAAPMVSGSAALVRSYFPTYTPEQVTALLKETSFNLYSIAGNAAYADKLGRGRLDVGAALTVTPGPSIKMITRNWTDGNNNVFSPGEIVSLSGNFINWLNPSSAALKCTLSTSNPYVTLIDSIVTIGVLNNLAIFANGSSPFRFQVSGACPENTTVLFKLKFNDGTYKDKQFFSLEINPTYLNVTQNKVFTSFSSNGRIGYVDENQLHGLGLSKNGNLQHLVVSSFMLANSATNVSDAGIGSSVTPFSNDFVPVIPATQLATPEIADFDAYGSFNDDNAGANKLNVLSNYKIWAWDDPGLTDFVIVEYTLKNTGAGNLSNLFSGIYSYWQMPNGQFYNQQYMANWDGSRKLGYGYNAANPVGSYAGMKLLSYDAVSWYAINNNGAGGSVNLFDGFSEAEKYTVMANGVSRTTTVAGTVSGVLGTGPLTIPVGDSVKVAFALVLADNLPALQAAADAAQVQYDKLHATWTGAISTNWNDPGNWFPNMVPNACITDVTIPFTANQPSITGADFTVGNITAADDVVISVQNGYALNVCKNIQAGTTTGTSVSGGKLKLVGGSNQRLSGNLTSTFVNLSNPVGAAIQPTALLSVDSGLELQSGTLVTNGNLTLLSDASGTAYVNNFSAGYTGSLVGAIHVQRYNPIGIAGFRQLGTPVQLPDISLLSGFTPSGTPGFITPLPSCDPNFVAANSPYGNWMQLVENGTVQYNCAQSLFQVLTSGGMTNGRGYYLDVPGNSTLTFTGPANDGTVSFGLTHANAAVTNGWNMVSNPYPSPLQWEMSNVPAGVDAIGKIWQTSGAYSGTFMDLDPSLGGIQSVAIGQAFQVRVSTVGASVPFLVDNTDRTIVPPTYLFAGNDPMTLNIDLLGSGFADLTKVRFIDNSTTAYDAMFDSPKMNGNSNQPMVYSVWNGKSYSTNSLGNFGNVYAVPLGVKLAQTDTYTLAFSNLDQFPATAFIYLEDTQNGTMQDLRNSDTYTFTHTAGTDESRFILHFYPPMQSTVQNVTCSAKGTVTFTETAPVIWNYTLNHQNAVVSQGTINGSTQINNLDTGTYVLMLTEQTSGYSTSQQIFVNGVTQVQAQPTASAISVQTGDEIQFMANATNADLYLWDFGDLATSNDANPLHVYNAPGIYQVVFTASNNTCNKTVSLTITVNGHAGIMEQIANSGVKIWADHNLVTISWEEKWAGKTLFTLYDAAGKKVFQKQLNDAQGTISIDCGVLAAGIYTVELQGNDKRISRKITKGIE